MVCAILKVTYQGEIRRTRVTKNEIVYRDIVEAVSALFPDVKEYAAMYLDDEGDACTLCEASFSDFLAMSKKAASQDAQHPEKLLLKLEIKDDVRRSTGKVPFEKQLKQAIEHVVHGLDLAQCFEEAFHGSPAHGGEDYSHCSEPMLRSSSSSSSVSFTDTEGDRSTLRLDHQMLSWHAGGRCYLEHIQRLEFDADTNAISAPEHPALVARLVDPPAGLQRDALIQDIVQMAGAAGVELHGFPIQESLQKTEIEMHQTQECHPEEQNAEKLRQKAEKEARKAHKEKMKAEREGRLAEKERQQAERDALKAHKEKLKNEKAAKLAEKETQRAEKAAKLAEKESQKAEKEAQKAEKERQKAERLIEKEATVAEKKALMQLQKETQKTEKRTRKAEKKAVNGNEGGESPGETVDEPPAARFAFPVVLADGCELHMVWSSGDDLQQVGAQFAKEHGLPVEIIPQLVSHAQQLDKSSSEPAAAEEDPLQPQIRLLQDMCTHHQFDDQVLRSLLVSCNGDVHSVIEMLLHQ
eukprot:TRINITY_DN2925_c1_g1_i1.p1 TRINITY_DN2925_c1_g1~~TRINITY_DN2925_c1_g1_i1.p1  ORF type:complete len:525 (-),score=162.95 TRINITY_DN2925_c1_g1_i1:415-1989(-)